jgi:hypothetical protein
VQRESVAEKAKVQIKRTAISFETVFSFLGPWDKWKRNQTGAIRSARIVADMMTDTAISIRSRL